MVYRVEFLIEIYCKDKRGVNASITVFLLVKSFLRMILPFWLITILVIHYSHYYTIGIYVRETRINKKDETQNPCWKHIFCLLIYAENPFKN